MLKAFYYICPTHAQYMLTITFLYSTPTCFDVYASFSRSFLLCMLKLQINQMVMGCYKELTD